MNTLTPEDKERIEREAEEWSDFGVYDKFAYKAGATSERLKVSEEIERLKMENEQFREIAKDYLITIDIMNNNKLSHHDEKLLEIKPKIEEILK